jgi:hypothetical protein
VLDTGPQLVAVACLSAPDDDSTHVPRDPQLLSAIALQLWNAGDASAISPPER